MRTLSVADVLSSSWWTDFLLVKDSIGWGALEKRFDVSEPVLKAALAAAGGTKERARPGRKPKSGEVPVRPGGSIHEGKPDSGVTAHKRALLSSDRGVPQGSVLRRRRAADGAVNEVRSSEIRAFSQVSPAIVATSSNPLEAFLSELGKVGDGVIAEAAGVPRWRVVEYRKKMGIPAYDGFRFQRRGESSAPPEVLAPKPSAEVNSRGSRPSPVKRLTAIGFRRAGRSSPLDAHVALLGTMPDSAVANRIGVTVAAVTQYRRRRGIIPAGRQPRPPISPPPAVVRPVATVREVPESSPGPAVAARPAEVSEMFAYRVTVRNKAEERKFFTLAPNIAVGLSLVEAALALRGDGPWTVSCVRLSGDALR